VSHKSIQEFEAALAQIVHFISIFDQEYRFLKVFDKRIQW